MDEQMQDVLIKAINDLRREVKDLRHELRLFETAVNARNTVGRKARAGR